MPLSSTVFTTTSSEEILFNVAEYKNEIIIFNVFKCLNGTKNTLRYAINSTSERFFWMWQKPECMQSILLASKLWSRRITEKGLNSMILFVKKMFMSSLRTKTLRLRRSGRISDYASSSWHITSCNTFNLGIIS